MVSTLNKISITRYLNQLPNGIINIVLRSCMSYDTQRHQGYINKFPANSDKSIGFIVKNNEPDKQYIFHVDDIHSEDTKNVRQYEMIEFDIIDGNPYKQAKNITAPSMQLIKCFHQNSSLNVQLKTKRLSQIETMHSKYKIRYKGIVQSINIEKQQGFICPDQLYCDLIYFHLSEIDCTGIAKLKENDYVSFYVNYGYPFDIASAIKRCDGGLITFEDFHIGTHRRILGEIYNKNDKTAKENIPKEFINNRYSGYIIHHKENKLLGYILPFNDYNQLISIHVDDCHMFGNRKLRRFQKVEFCIQLNNQHKNSQCKYRAIHVTGPNLSILHYNYDNYYLPNDMKSKELIKYDQDKYDNDKRFDGIITNINNNKYEITLNLYGYKSIIGNESEFRSVGNKSFQIGDCVEFHINNKTQKPFHITAQGGYPFICEYSNSDYSQYLRKRFELTTFRKHFISYNIDSNDGDEIGFGYIASFNQENQFGTIEIISFDENIRYKQVLFHFKDCHPSFKKLDSIKNQKIMFRMQEMNKISGEENAEFFPFIPRKDLDLSKKAVDIQLFKDKKNHIYNNNNYKVTQNNKTNLMNQTNLNETKQKKREKKLNKINKILINLNNRYKFQQ